MEPTNTFLQRVNMLELFKHIDFMYFDLELDSTQGRCGIRSTL